LRDLAIAAYDAADAFEFFDGLVVHLHDVVQGVGDLARLARPFGRESLGEVALLEGHQGFQEQLGIECV
jgi:hypothetical protein